MAMFAFGAGERNNLVLCVIHLKLSIKNFKKDWSKQNNYNIKMMMVQKMNKEANDNRTKK